MTSEESLLSTFLLPRAPLSSFLTLSQFGELFPRSYREPVLHPGIPVLYHELQHQRALVIDHVRENIANECTRSEKLQREMNLKKYLSRQSDAAAGRARREVEMEVAVCIFFCS